MQNMNTNLNTTLCFLIENDNVYLAKKLNTKDSNKIGQGKYNGYGGTAKIGETIEETAIREVFEESKCDIKQRDLEMRALIDFYFPHKPEKNQKVRVYFVNKWEGNPTKSTEMDYPKPFPMNKLPYDEMFASDKIWLERVMSGEKLKGYFIWNPDMSVKEYSLIKVQSF